MQATIAAILLVIQIGEVRGSDGRTPLVLSASQRNALSVRHAWTVHITGDAVLVERPGKSPRTRHLKPTEMTGLLRILEETRFVGLPNRLGVAGVCDDCSRCVVKTDTGAGAYEVIFESAGEVQGPPATSEEVQRFLASWRAIKAVAGLAAVPDACP